MSATISLRDVTLRDGLQDEDPIATDDKLAVFEALLAAGVRDLELTSFVRADRVPAMADAEALVAATRGAAATRWGLVLNRRGAERAIAAGLHQMQFVVSASEPHNLANAGRTVDASITDLTDIVGLARDGGGEVEATVATAFGCPHTGPVATNVVLDAVAGCVAAGVSAVSLADTIGTAAPNEVRSLVMAVRDAHPTVPVGLHLHDTRGMALANALAGIDAGATRLDAALGGLGGCPFAPGASGNLPLEDLAHALEAMGYDTGLDVDALIAASTLVCSLVGRDVASHVGVAGARFSRLVPPT